MITGIIAEYNPFHNGHKYHIEKTKTIVPGDIAVVMSGNFVQRGEPAIYSKYVRTRAALMNGADIVLELPVQYATGAADVFASGAVYILEKSGIADYLSFGSESGDISLLESIADVLAEEPGEYTDLLKKYSSEGLSYPGARGKALSEYMHLDESIFLSSNDILSVEYIRELKMLGSSIKPVCIKRTGSSYTDENTDCEFPSALAIRNEIIKGSENALEKVPDNCRSLFSKEHITVSDDFSDMLKYALITRDRKYLSETADITEGLENRITDCDFSSITQLTDTIKTKRYTRLKIQRALLHIILDIKKQAQKTPPEYIRVLGFRKEKEYLLSMLAEKSSLRVITNVKENEDILKDEIRASEIYSAAGGGRKADEYRNPLVVV